MGELEHTIVGGKKMAGNPMASLGIILAGNRYLIHCSFHLIQKIQIITTTVGFKLRLITLLLTSAVKMVMRTADDKAKKNFNDENEMDDQKII